MAEPMPFGPLPSLASILGEPLPEVHIVDVGAAMLDSPERFGPLVAAGGARVTGFEPDATQRARIEALGRPRYRILPQALGRGGPGTLYLTRFPGCTSLYEPDPSIIDMFTGIGTVLPKGNFGVIGTLAVTTHRLDDVLADDGPDYLKIDVQGAELDVLEGAPQSLERCLVVECEVEFVPIYKQQPLFGDVARHLQAAGFMLHKLMDVSGRAYRPVVVQNNVSAPLSQLLWADALFIRDLRTIGSWSVPDLEKAAVVLHDVYGSVDVAVRLLLERDRRLGTSSMQRYGSFLGSAPLATTMVTVATPPPPR